MKVTAISEQIRFGLNERNIRNKKAYEKRAPHMRPEETHE